MTGNPNYRSHSVATFANERMSPKLYFSVNADFNNVRPATSSGAKPTRHKRSRKVLSRVVSAKAGSTKASSKEYRLIY